MPKGLSSHQPKGIQRVKRQLHGTGKPRNRLPKDQDRLAESLHHPVSPVWRTERRLLPGLRDWFYTRSGGVFPACKVRTG